VETIEVKVSPDELAEGRRLMVLPVALCAAQAAGI